MVAFGALEYDPPGSAAAFPNIGDPEYIAKADAAAEVFELVMREFKELGWLLSSRLAARHESKFLLLGPTIGSSQGGFKGRQKIAEGTLQDVCRAAVEWMDKPIVPVPTIDIYPE